MITAGEIYSYLDSVFPFSTQDGFDNAGFLFGSKGKKVEKVLIALDITAETVGEAVKENCQLIISHHPVIFHKLAGVSPDDPTGKRVLALAAADISAICLHTNLDKADGGVNDVLVKKLGAVRAEKCDSDPYLRIGFLPEPIPMERFLKQTKENLQTNGLRYYDCGRPVYQFACLGGAGDDSLAEAFALGCDTFVTSDISYHSFLDAKEIGINLIDGDHFCTENPVLNVLFSLLTNQFPEIAFKISDLHRQVIRFY